MADKFYDGMPNVNEELNKMNAAFEKGPYNALPLTGGALTGPVTSTSRISAESLVGGAGVTAGAVGWTASAIQAPNNGAAGASGVYYDVAAYGVTSAPGVWGGRFSWSTCGGFGSAFSAGYKMILRATDASTMIPSSPILEVTGSGDVSIGRFLTAGPVAVASKHQLYRDVAEFGEILRVARANPWSCFAINGSSGTGGWGAGASVMYVGRNSTTGRSIGTAGTINASGADYAEYMVKSPFCSPVAPGQIIGIDASGKLTDQWGDAISFVVKSTDPCMVGGDSWSQDIGGRPAGSERTENMDDEEWAAIEVGIEAAQAAFDVALEAARQKVDRIAFSGQVPVNVMGALPGQYIVPSQDGDSIAGLAINEDDMTLKQYMRSIGKVIAIEDDGRARIIIKVA
ncbi:MULTISPECIES: hypothetical protein [unclassified Janthinobacterium]|uniref:hypothetical protein n=1 Tax=unclassified Janthinobacterium TaxID=2610881 RepID=UPI001618CFD0|nr:MULTISPECIES: hypothetical protein [unclassified Janthinobacterium]MBB5610443.1 hypothetical protein [Janthinobacterium sp. S3T4]MBB5615720.1 hypothetical protein [Janthinobacterium sp. S3M3]